MCLRRHDMGQGRAALSFPQPRIFLSSIHSRRHPYRALAIHMLPALTCTPDVRCTPPALIPLYAVHHPFSAVSPVLVPRYMPSLAPLQYAVLSAALSTEVPLYPLLFSLPIRSLPDLERQLISPPLSLSPETLIFSLTAQGSTAVFSPHVSFPLRASLLAYGLGSSPVSPPSRRVILIPGYLDTCSSPQSAALPRQRYRPSSASSADDTRSAAPLPRAGACFSSHWRPGVWTKTRQPPSCSPSTRQLIPLSPSHHPH
ncbi:hypothetical protein OE88DRAFT_286435 [Heliocybe sulcata]|uniref:Uncharacterized protein n=1 Tax=Heliocybe sulcata TaxID=5364 RepID=A0A5C3N2N9_9AGAM|nr:hypothetical protein OE88DRAFT_286435 [Heliocybe sulcata]